MVDGDFSLKSGFVVANGFRIAKDYEKAKEALEKASKGQELISSYPHSLLLVCSVLRALSNFV